MKHSQTIGILAALALIGICFADWIYVPSLRQSFNGFSGKVNEFLNFGKQVKPHSFFCCISIALFLTAKVWAKRANIFIALLNFSWALKNYILFSMCRSGECPTIQWGLYTLVALAFIIQLMALLPRLEIKKR